MTVDPVPKLHPFAERMVAYGIIPPPPEPSRPATSTVTDAPSYARKALAAEVERVRSAPDGTRNDVLNKAAFNLGQLVAGGLLDDGAVIDALYAASTDNGYVHSDGERKTRATIRSGIQAGSQHPRIPKPSTAGETKPMPAFDDATPSRRTHYTAVGLMDTTFPEPRYAVPGLIAEGLNLLAGGPKIGKSWLGLGLGVAIASGGRALGSIPVDQGDVLYLALEDTPRRLQSRLRSVLQGAPAPDGLNFATEWRPMPEGGADDVDAALTHRPGCRLVIVDVLAKVRGRVDDRGNRYDQDYAAVSALKTIADRHAVAVLVLHHVRKASADDFVDTVSGTHGLAGAADAILVMQRARNSAEARLHITGRDVEETTRAVEFDAKVGTWKLLDGPASDYDLSAERRAILDAVRAQEGMGPKAIAEATGLSHDVVKQLVRKMAEATQLDTDGSGHYFAPVTIPLPIHPVHSVHQSPVNAVNGVNGDGGSQW